MKGDMYEKYYSKKREFEYGQVEDTVSRSLWIIWQQEVLLEDKSLHDKSKYKWFYVRV